MEGEIVVMVVAGAAVVAALIVKFGSRQPTEHRPVHSGDHADGEHEATPDAATGSPDAPSARRRLAARIPRQRRGTDADPPVQPRADPRTPVDTELMRTLEELAAHPQNRAAAVNLLRQRTGMSARHARRFINAL